MRRFTQRNALVTLSDINLTPLLDLAWTLLIIFMITAPLLEHSMDLELPGGGRPPLQVNRQDLAEVEIDAAGSYRVNGEPLGIDQLEQAVVALYGQNPNLVVRIRADREGTLQHFYPVIDRLTRNNITRISLATRPEDRR
ncbi:MAG: biopolymer transporter ExbD [Verrucomicrobiales bacterium]|nr:biopolymer transporter ExbD [Verrucomicrobiales bacterium]MCP5527416.1 biopolymer transporter ExbD [Verrucomicrobiales bacterium]